MDILQAIILGVVEGFTEFLPISSTGHLIVVSDWLGLPQDDANTAFEIIIQLAAILAVIAAYRDKFTPGHVDLWMKLALAFVPIGAVGFLFSHQIKALFSVSVVATMFIVGGLAFLALEAWYRKRPHPGLGDVEKVSWKQSLWIGIAQVAALIPGTSRAGSTIVGALLVGLDRKASAEFSFLLALPVMLATTAYELLKNYREFSGANWMNLGVGFVVAFVVAYFTMLGFIRFLKNFTFVAFGVYRILFGVILLIAYA
ncbi:MAG: undecaprenyl-diphosphate phosphatase [Gammaproteobacteria bacterium]|nr:undecaprenyl-diphosphate phosphatase [Gammaproteobacteria bacterium]MCP5137983.1 undecaprenyl-diphosphate phosphatase [Gammaproteobacteria bacterium]